MAISEQHIDIIREDITDDDKKLSAINTTVKSAHQKYLMTLKMRELSKEEKRIGKSCLKWSDSELFDFISKSPYSEDMNLFRVVLREYFQTNNQKFPVIIDKVDFLNVTPDCVNDMKWDKHSIINVNKNLFDNMARNREEAFEIYSLFLAYSLLCYYNAKIKADDIFECQIQKSGDKYYLSSYGVTFSVDEKTKNFFKAVAMTAQRNNYSFKSYRDCWSHKRQGDDRFKSFSIYAIRWSGIYRRMYEYDLKNDGIISAGFIQRKLLIQFGHPKIRNNDDFQKAIRRYNQWRKTFGLNF